MSEKKRNEAWKEVYKSYISSVISDAIEKAKNDSDFLKKALEIAIFRKLSEKYSKDTDKTTVANGGVSFLKKDFDYVERIKAHKTSEKELLIKKLLKHNPKLREKSLKKLTIEELETLLKAYERK